MAARKCEICVEDICLFDTRNKFRISKHPFTILFISETFKHKTEFLLRTEYDKNMK